MVESIRAVDSALEILLSFSPEKPWLSLTEISESVGMSKSTVHRFGFLFLELAGQLTDDASEQWSIPYLEYLAKKYSETVDLAVLDGEYMMYQRMIESNQHVTNAVSSGQRLPAFCTAAGSELESPIYDGSTRCFVTKNQIWRLTQ